MNQIESTYELSDNTKLFLTIERVFDKHGEEDLKIGVSWQPVIDPVHVCTLIKSEFGAITDHCWDEWSGAEEEFRQEHGAFGDGGFNEDQYDR